jgi:hypothetical protein
MFFADDDGRGWSEKYWMSTDLGQSGWQTLVAALIQVRKALSTPSVKILHTRIQSANPRQPYVLISASGSPIIGTFIGEQSPADVAVLTRLRSAANQFNRVFLRGVPESISRGEEKVPDAIWDPLFDAYGNFLVGNGNFIVRSRTAGVAPKPVVSMGPNSGKGILLTVPAADAALSIGQTVYISGTGIPGYNGPKTVVQDNGSGGPGHSYVLGGANPVSTPPSVAAVRYKPLTYNVPAVAGVDPEGISNRKVGRPFGLSAGRRRTTFNLRP